MYIYFEIYTHYPDVKVHEIPPIDHADILLLLFLSIPIYTFIIRSDTTGNNRCDAVFTGDSGVVLISFIPYLSGITGNGLQ